MINYLKLFNKTTLKLLFANKMQLTKIKGKSIYFSFENNV